MTEGRLVEWLKKPGERIERSDVIAVIETDKANVEVESWVAGTMEKILVEPGDQWMPVGTPLAAIRTDGVEPVAPPAFAQPAPSAPVQAAPPAPIAPSGPALPGERLRASPAARRRAQELGVDLASVQVTGPDSRITLEDVERAASTKPPSIAANACARRSRRRCRARKGRSPTTTSPP
jgi:pyruvate dehydrogenase E2 component (dihydrolipoamide acetyltransferase)